MTVEDRLRGALNARAEQITADRLAPALPPTATTYRRRTAGPMVAAAAAVAVLTGGIIVGHHLLEAPAAPAAPTAPAVTVPPDPRLLKTPEPGLKQKLDTPQHKGEINTEKLPEKPLPGMPWDNGIGSGYPSAGTTPIDPGPAKSELAKSKKAAVEGAVAPGPSGVAPPLPTGDPADTGP